MIDHAVEGEHRAGVDLAWIVVVASLVCAAAIYWQIPDRLLARLDEFDRWNVNGILALIVVVPLGATLFAMRRYRDAVGAQEELSRLSMHDALTGLPNRRHLREVMPQALRHARRRNTRAAVLFLDLDGFKTVNDTYGHEVGDRLMTAVARRIRDGAGPGRLTARYAGDEFVVVDPEPVTADHASRLGRELVELVETPFELGEDRITVSASVGVAFGDSSSDPEELIRNADVAMYEAKRSTDRVAVFDTGMRAGITPVNAERRLEAALAAGQFRLLYQPIVALRSGQMIGVEALLRWEDPERGTVRPVEFLGALEDTGLIVPVGRWILEEACRQAQRWASVGEAGRALRVTVNVSSRQLSQSDFVDDVHRAVEASGVEPALIHLELSESTLLGDRRTTWDTLTKVRELGVGLALDDFGTGFSSISHLRDFDLDLLKLDRSFVVELGRQAEEDAIIRHIVALARSLHIATLAEGISSQSQVDHLLEIGCDLGQGFYFAGAQPDSVIDALLQHDVRTTPPPPPTPSPSSQSSGTVVVAERRGSGEPRN